MRSSEELDEFIAGTLLPELRIERGKVEALRRLRQAVRMTPRTRAIIWGVGLAVAAFARDLGVLILFFALPWIIDFYRMIQVKGPRTMDVKADLIRRVIEFWGSGFAFQPHRGIPQKEFERSRLIDQSFSRYRSMDLVAGKHGATAFRFAEVELANKQDEAWKTVWSGIFLVADFNKTFRSHLWVLPDRTERHLGLVARALQRLPIGGRGGLIHLESPAFERHFKVYGDDPQEARYILSPSLMRRIVELRESMDLEIEMAFLDGQVYVALPVVNDFFSAPSVEQINETHIHGWVTELGFLTSIIEALDLNTRIWSKGADSAS